MVRQCQDRVEGLLSWQVRSRHSGRVVMYNVSERHPGKQYDSVVRNPLGQQHALSDRTRCYVGAKCG